MAGTFGDESEVCERCGGEIYLGLNHWLHTNRQRPVTRDSIYCRDEDGKALHPLTRAKPMIWLEAE